MPYNAGLYTQMWPSTQMPYPANVQMPFRQPVSPLPTGVPTGPAVAPPPEIPPVLTTSLTPVPGPSPQTLTDVLYTPGFLRTQIGRTVRVEFLIGTTSLVDRMGTLVGVGASYILIREVETDDVLLCDIYSIKFVRFYY